jgi:hypothetical protein
MCHAEVGCLGGLWIEEERLVDKYSLDGEKTSW